MPHISSADVAYKITAPDGTALWQGMALAGHIFLVQNKEASATIAAGEAVRLDAASFVLSHFNLAATASPPVQVFGGLRSSAVANVNWIGVAIETIPVGKLGRVIGAGSICGVQCVSGGGTNAVNAQVAGSATAGLVTSTAVWTLAAGVPTAGVVAQGTVLGSVLSISGAVGPPTDMGSATVLGVFVKGLY